MAGGGRCGFPPPAVGEHLPNLPAYAIATRCTAGNEPGHQTSGSYLGIATLNRGPGKALLPASNAGAYNHSEVRGAQSLAK